MRSFGRTDEQAIEVFHCGDPRSKAKSSTNPTISGSSAMVSTWSFDFWVLVWKLVARIGVSMLVTAEVWLSNFVRKLCEVEIDLYAKITVGSLSWSWLEDPAGRQAVRTIIKELHFRMVISCSEVIFNHRAQVKLFLMFSMVLWIIYLGNSSCCLIAYGLAFWLRMVNLSLFAWVHWSIGAEIGFILNQSLALVLFWSYISVNTQLYDVFL